MRRIVPVIVFAVGVVLIVLGLTEVLPGITGGGASLAFLGALLFGLGFVPRLTADEVSPAIPPPPPNFGGEMPTDQLTPVAVENANYVAGEPPLSELERLTKIFYAPAEVFANLRRHPRWLAPLLIMAVVSSVYTLAFTQRITPETIVKFTTGKLAESGFVPPDQIDKMRSDQIKQLKDPVSQIGTAISGFVGLFALIAFVALIYLGVVLAFGGKINYWQGFSATAYSFFPVTVVLYVLNLGILYLKDPADVHPILGQGSLVQDNLGILFSPADNPVLYSLASVIGVLSLYGLWLAATGLRNSGERVSTSTAWTAAGLVWLIGVVFRVASAALFPSFLS